MVDALIVGFVVDCRTRYPYFLRTWTRLNVERFSDDQGQFQSSMCACKSTDLNNTGAITEAGPEEHVRVCEESLLQADDDELGAFEARSEQLADVLGM